MIEQITTHLTATVISMTFLEVTAVILSIVYVVLAARRNIWCWPAAFISSGIYCYLFSEVNLKQDAALQIYYVAMAVYGWQQWRKNETEQTISIVQLPRSWHFQAILIVTGVALTSGFIAKTWFNSDYPWLDGLTTWFSIYATWLVTKSVLENWLYWIVIDAISIYLYWNKELYFVVALFVIYVVIAIHGYFKWKQQLDQQRIQLDPQSA